MQDSLTWLTYAYIFVLHIECADCIAPVRARFQPCNSCRLLCPAGAKATDADISILHANLKSDVWNSDISLIITAECKTLPLLLSGIIYHNH